MIYLLLNSSNKGCSIGGLEMTKLYEILFGKSRVCVLKGFLKKELVLKRYFEIARVNQEGNPFLNDYKIKRINTNNSQYLNLLRQADCVE